MTDTAARLTQQFHDRIHLLLFDYSRWASYWAANDHIAPCLAAYVNQVSDAYRTAGGDGKVIVVAHSMGALALRYAASSDFAQPPIKAGVVPYVISLGTPSLGSPWGDSPTAYLQELFNWVKDHDKLPAPWGQDGQTCLKEHQDGADLPKVCSGLPPWLPAGTHLTQIAGNITIDRTVFGFSLYTIPLNADGVVRVPSAHGYLISGPGGTAPAGEVVTINRPVDACTIGASSLSDTLRHFARELGVALPRGFTDYLTLQSLQKDQFSGPVQAYFLAATVSAPCSHIHITTDQSAINQTTEAIKTALAALDQAQPADLHKFDFRNAVVPAKLCLTTRDIQLRDGAATDIASQFGHIDVGSLNKVVFGDLDGDGHDEAGFDVFCNYHGGNGVPQQGYVIYGSVRGQPKPLGVVDARYQPDHTSRSAVDTITIKKHHVIAAELWYQDGDGHCCPTGHATTNWTYTNGTFTPGPTRTGP